MSDWEWRTNGLYDGDVPILWVTQDHTGKLYLGVFADYEDAIRTVPDLLAKNERLRRALSQAGRTMCGMCEIEMCLSPCIGRQDILDALKEEK